MAGSTVDHVRTLRREAESTNERRLVVLAGDQTRSYRLLRAVLSRIDIPAAASTLVGPEDRLACDHVDPTAARTLLGTTRAAVIYDTHGALVPNTLGIVSGVVDGGGLLFLLAPALDRWPDRRDAFDASLADHPYGPDDVGNRFKRRVVRTLREHRGVAIVEVDGDGTHRVVKSGLTAPPPSPEPTPDPTPRPPDEHRFPIAAYDRCLTDDQVRAVRALESLDSAPAATVIEADRGRGKSSALGIAAGCYAAVGREVLVTAPESRGASVVFDRAREVLAAIGQPVEPSGDRTLLAGDGAVRFAEAAALDIDSVAPRPDVLLVDEAAAIPVGQLTRLLAVDRVAFATTIHGYEGAGRGFSVRFRDRLDAAAHAVTECTLSTPIRYAAGDPIEVWAFRTLLLDARPAHDAVVESATPATADFERLDREALASNPRRLRAIFGLLVLAHYRTEPNDLARLLDAPALAVAGVFADEHPVAVAVTAEEGGLTAEHCRDLYAGGHIAGHMLPDLLISQLRDEAAGRPTGRRIVRIATHGAVRSRGLGSALVSRLVEDADDGVDWVGVGFGATPSLVRFWARNDFRPVHLSIGRNDRSGEHSAIMLRPRTPAGRSLVDRQTGWFLERMPGVLADPLSHVDADVVRAILRAADGSIPLDLSDRAWRHVAAAAFGHGHYDIAPGPFRSITLAAAVDGTADRVLEPTQQRLLVEKGIQGRPWQAVADRHDFSSVRTCMLALGEAFQPLVEEYGPPVAFEERDRYSAHGQDRDPNQCADPD